MDNNHQKVCINQRRPVYFSYARNSNRKPEWNHISDCVDKIIDLFKQRNIEYRLDVRDIGAGDNISDFEREIGWNSEVVVLVFSDKYFRSLHCMYEFVQIRSALKKYPKKRLLCVKSGDVDLSDQKYLLELEHYWGNIKQEYETIEFHHLRNHSGTEQAAFENGFYVNEIRNLYAFFKDIPCYDADSDDFNILANEVTNYFANVSTSFFQVVDRRRQLFNFFKGLGCSVFVFFLISVLFAVIDDSFDYCDVDYPLYKENIFFQDNEDYTNVTKVWGDYDFIFVALHSVNLTDDTLRKVRIDSSAYIKCGEYFYPMLEVYGCDNKKIPEYYPGGKGSFVDYYMKFNRMSLVEPISLFFSNGRGIFDITLSTGLDKPGIKHPYYRESPKNVFVKSIENTSLATVVHMHYVNSSANDTLVHVSRTCSMQTKDLKFNIGCTNGITFDPFTTRVPAFSTLDFALYFDTIDLNDSIDLFLNDSVGVFGLSLHRDTIRTVANPLVSGHSLGGGLITKIELGRNETVIHFRYENKFNKHSIFTAANSKSYIVANGEKYMVQGVSGISMFPERTLIPANTSIEYALFFPPIPPDTESIDFVNVEYSRERLGDRYKVLVAILGAECANEEDNAVLTGIFGIQIPLND